MKLPLVRKEVREHWVVLCIVLAIDAFMLFGMLIRAAEKSGRFTALVQLVESLGAVTAVVAANRLFAREYAGRTQLFLEVLPIGRPRVWATKWLLGFAYLTVLTVAAWTATWRRSLRTEVISTQDALLVLVCVGSFMLVVWCFACMAGMLGRHRYTAWFAGLFIALLVVERGHLSLQELPVLKLLGSSVEMAHVTLDWRALLEAWFLAACFAAASATLALAGSGAIASALAQKMTARERVFMFVVFVVGTFAYGTADEGRAKLPFTVSDAIYAKNTKLRVGVLRRGGIADAVAEHVAQSIADDLESMKQELSLDPLPPVFVLPKQNLDSTVIERAELEKKDGIVLRVAPDVELSRLRATVLHDALVRQTRQRAAREDRHALLDGYATWWTVRADPRERELRWLRAAAAGLPVSAAALTRWEETAERTGECVADGLAFAAFEMLSRRLGPEPTRTFARTLFSRPPDDVRVLFERSPAALLEDAGTTWSELATETERERRAVMKRRSAELSRLAQLSAAVAVEQTARHGARIEVGLAGAEAYWAVYAVLAPWARWQASLSRLDVRAARATLPLSAPRGARVFVAVETDAPSLGCPVRVASKRVRLP